MNRGTMDQSEYNQFINLIYGKIDTLIQQGRIRNRPPGPDWRYDLAMDAYLMHLEENIPISEALLRVYDAQDGRTRICLKGRRFRVKVQSLEQLIGRDPIHPPDDHWYQYIHELQPLLSHKENMVLGFTLDRYTQEEVAGFLGTNQTDISRTLDSIKNKLHQFKERKKKNAKPV